MTRMNDINDAEFIVRPINSNPLKESEAEILREAVKKIQDQQRKKFDESMKRASEIVASWPKWKRDLADQVLR